MAIQKAVVSYLRRLNFKVAANNNEHAREHVDMGVDIGSADLVICRKIGDTTYFLYLELKTKKGKLSINQKKWNEDFDQNYKSSNCIRAIAYGYNQAIEEINLWTQKNHQHFSMVGGSF